MWMFFNNVSSINDLHVIRLMLSIYFLFFQGILRDVYFTYSNITIYMMMIMMIMMIMMMILFGLVVVNEEEGDRNTLGYLLLVYLVCWILLCCDPLTE